MTRRRLVLAGLAAAAGLAWMNPARDRLLEANRLFAEGKYEEALTHYGEALVDDPDSAMLNFNMGTANYKAGKHAEALASFARVEPSADDPTRIARAAYNAGNTHYRIGAAAEATAPQDALTAYAAALAAYRRALAIDPADRDSKFNYEFVSKKLDELQRKLAEQQQQQQDQRPPEQQEQQQEQQPQQQQEQQQPEQQEQPPQSQPQESPDQQAAPTAEPAPQPPETPGSPEPAEAPQPPAADEAPQEAERDAGTQPAPPESAGAEAGGAAPDEAAGGPRDQMSPAEAAALVDSAKQDEMEPGEFARQAQGAAVAEPARDW